MKRDYLRVGTLIRETDGHRRWSKGQLLRIVSRKTNGPRYYPDYRYFIVADGDPPGHGTWLGGKAVRELNALEQLAAQMD